MSESRRFSRIAFDASVQLHIHLIDNVHTAHLRDISLKGALVEIDAPITTYINQRTCSMTLVLAADGQQITMQGRIIHHEGRLIGLESLHMDIDSITNLRKLILFNTGEKKLLETELAEMLTSYQS